MGQQVTNNEIEIRCLASDLRIEQRDAETVSRTITGYAAKFDTWSEPIFGWFREKIARGAFDGCDMQDVIMCFNHRDDAILSRTMSGTLQLTVDEVGLRFTFEAPNTTLGNDMLELVRRGDISKCSFRFGVAEDAWVYADEQNGLEMDERTILKFSRVWMCRSWYSRPIRIPKRRYGIWKNGNRSGSRQKGRRRMWSESDMNAFRGNGWWRR